jgi:UDP-N-acetylmuramate dehydrogenase
VTANPDLDALAAALGPRARRDEPLARYTAMRVGGPADLLIVCERTDDVVGAVELARRHNVPWRVLGGGCNVLVADRGVRGLVIVNRAARITFDPAAGVAWAEAGALLAVLAREAVERGLAGLEWAAGLPGAVGGAVVGNAGAFEGDVASVLRSATVLGPDSVVVERPNEWFEFDYRLSRIKRAGGRKQEAGGRKQEAGGRKQEARSRKQEARSRKQEVGGEGHVVLAATFGLRPGDPEPLAVRADEILEWRRTRHPSGATMGSTFKNPPGSHAGYLIEQAGLQGTRIGGAQISALHGNFFMNTGTATAADVLALIEHARAQVKHQFGLELELEIELVGRW